MQNIQTLHKNADREQKWQILIEIIIYTYIFLYLYAFQEENHFLIPEKLCINKKNLTFASTIDTIYYMVTEKVKIDLLFETSWEVCNKIGGIYTVLSTKAKTLQKLYKDKVIFIGPDVWTEENPSPYFSETKTTLSTWAQTAELPYGIKIRTGRWNVPGRPLVILVKFDSMYEHNNDLYGKMWEKYGVDSLHAYGDYDEACAFSHAAALVIENLSDYKWARSKNIIAHFDEWTTGMGLLHVKSHKPEIATIFTTHATSIGRSICGNGKPLYDYLKGYNGDQMARELNMEAKHSLEKAAAHNADCFTTVSEITALECEQLLEKRPDVVTPNGFEDTFIPSRSVYAEKQTAARKILLETAGALTGKNYPDDCFIIATSGRYEYRNKGLDLYLDSLKMVSDRQPKNRILAFVMVPAWVKDYREDLKTAILNVQTSRLEEPIITHTVNNPYDDAVLNSMRRLEFNNSEDSNLDVIYVPCYLNGSDGIFNKTYYELLIGMNMTIFPSYYEPWGYTPLESVAFGVPTVTTSLSGFGQWIMQTGNTGFSKSGVDVVPRTDSNYHEVALKIAEDIIELSNIDEQKRRDLSAAARSTANMAAWGYFIKYYIMSFKEAFSKMQMRNEL